ncbi:hypothetical protein MPSI1_001896 [Malassezia psittaci]|uniref:Protein kinase domain-containing protein n=1 Tax=Malassezia psittaci TaxID=1821823 RepID=A0AAF0FEJ5_9BASI|nr:hypothetical protein MPSI1_001896 [Malassezia psittaci]
MLDPVGIYGPVRGASAQREPGSAQRSSNAASKGDSTTHRKSETFRRRPSNESGASSNSSSAVARAQEKSKAAAAAAKRERQEWERTRGAGSNVLLWYEDLRENQPSALNGFQWSAIEIVPTTDEIMARKHSAVNVVGMDRLLDWGICDYTVLPRTLGRGRFSTVYLAVKNGKKFAVKHTPLFPHHELVATRLLREPTLLAELPPHPNLVEVVETIRTPGHFYLVEEYLEGYITLEALIPKLSTTKPPKAPVLPLDVAEKIFSQLVLALYTIHWPLRICHRDVKPENILVHPDTLHLKLLDFGLATHFSKSRAKLTTCCGSPAFHCPEIVTALLQPPGSMSYWGPEVDAWTCGVTLLRCLSGIKYPLGTSHSSPQAMASRVKRVLQTLPSHPLRDQIARLLDINGEKRMKNFEELAQTYLSRQTNQYEPARRELKSTSFCPNMPQYSMILPLVLDNDSKAHNGPMPAALNSSAATDGENSHYTRLTLLNPTKLHNLRVLSFIKYCFRCAGILYHAIPDKDDGALQRLQWQAALGYDQGNGSIPVTPYGDPSKTSQIFECVVELTEEESQGPISALVNSLLTMFGQKSKPDPQIIMPPYSEQSGDALPVPGKEKPVKPSSGPSGKQGSLRMLVFQMLVNFPSASDGFDLDFSLHDLTGNLHPSSSQQMLATPKRSHSSRPPTSEEPDLSIDTRPEVLPQPSGVSSPARGAHASSSRKPKRSNPSKPGSIHVYVSDARAVPYVRGALSNGGIHKTDKPAPSRQVPQQPSTFESERKPSMDTYPPMSSPIRSGTTTPGADNMMLERFGSEELEASLESIDSACRSMILLRTQNPDQSPEQSTRVDQSKVITSAQHLYKLVLRLFTQLESSLSDALLREALREQMSSINFRALEVLAPALSLVNPIDSLPPDQAQVSANVGVESGKDRAASTGSLALAIIELFAQQTSVKEMCLGIQEQIEQLVVAYQAREISISSEEAQDESYQSTPLLYNDSMLVQVIFGLLQLLSVVLHEIETRSPQAVLEPIISLLYPRLFGNVLPTALTHIQDDDLAEELATQGAVLLCELIWSIHSFSKPHQHDKQVQVADLACVLIDCLAPLTHFLPHTVGQQSENSKDALLSVDFSRQNRSQDDEDNSHMLRVSKRITIWNIVRKTYDRLGLDLGQWCLGWSQDLQHSAATTGDTARGALQLLVQQLAYEAFMARVRERVRDRILCRTSQSTYLSEPSRWNATVGTEILTRFSSTLSSVLFDSLQAPNTPPAAKFVEHAQDIQQVDAILMLISWCIAALDQQESPSRLDERCSTTIVHVLALFSVCVTEPSLRQVAFQLLGRIVRDYCSKDTTLRLVKELLSVDSPSMLRAAGVNLVRDICQTNLVALEQSNTDPASSDSILANGQIWKELEDELFILPELPKADVANREELDACLAQHDVYLMECCALYYYMSIRDKQNLSDFSEKQRQARLKQRFIEPLQRFCTEWQSFLDQLDTKLQLQLQLLCENVQRFDQLKSTNHSLTNDDTRTEL